MRHQDPGAPPPPLGCTEQRRGPCAVDPMFGDAGGAARSGGWEREGSKAVSQRLSSTFQAAVQATRGLRGSHYYQSCKWAPVCVSWVAAHFPEDLTSGSGSYVTILVNCGLILTPWGLDLPATLEYLPQAVFRNRWQLL
ncbi:hypothetical protein NDU88_011104 [Pleurodeles waltl]|uniref:Uncharacterized protein n=1 Tax=Pleurodeles waltl TaxID=8319 RepID=A0AAV7QW97_PLEWA|nr:hypothetical protein NDU88_011104 [Pleurodeles waltl]